MLSYLTFDIIFFSVKITDEKLQKVPPPSNDAKTIENFDCRVARITAIQLLPNGTHGICTLDFGIKHENLKNKAIVNMSSDIRELNNLKNKLVFVVCNAPILYIKPNKVPYLGFYRILENLVLTEDVMPGDVIRCRNYEHMKNPKSPFYNAENRVADWEQVFQKISIKNGYLCFDDSPFLIESNGKLEMIKGI